MTIKDKLDVLYNCLDVLDGKASALLTFNGIVAAIFTYLSTQAFASAPTSVAETFERLFVVFGLLITILSVWLCLWVARVSWRFFERAGTEPNINFDNELSNLAKAVERRTSRYQWAWFFSVAAMGFLAASLVISVLI